MATRRVGSGGRSRIQFAIMLLIFLAIAAAVILRRTYGISGERELQALDARRAALAAERLRLEGEIRTASGRAKLQPMAEERLDMHVPADSQVIILERGAP